MAIASYAMESVVLRTRKMMEHGTRSSELASAMTRAYLMAAMDTVESTARIVLAAASEGDLLRTQMAILRRLCKYEPFNTVALSQLIARRVIEAGKYVFI
jgi:butyryl-CoA dehydrogenase